MKLIYEYVSVKERGTKLSQPEVYTVDEWIAKEEKRAQVKNKSPVFTPASEILEVALANKQALLDKETSYEYVTIIQQVINEARDKGLFNVSVAFTKLKEIPDLYPDNDHISKTFFNISEACFNDVVGYYKGKLQQAGYGTAVTTVNGNYSVLEIYFNRSK